MPKMIIIVAAIAIAVIAIASAGAYYIYYSETGPVSEPSGKYHYAWTADGRTFNISLIAANESAREHGLMNATVTNSTLMIFVWPGKEYNLLFWMYDTYTNLDMMWLDVGANGTGKVVYVAANATSCTSPKNETEAQLVCKVYGDPDALANYVIEAKAGFAARNNITVGMNVSLERVSG